MARNDGRTRAPNVFGKPGVSYPEDALASPTIIEERTVSQVEPKKAMLVVHPKYSTAFLISQDSEKGDNSDAILREKYQTLPGPWITTRSYIAANLFKEVKRRAVKATTNPGGSVNQSSDTVTGESTTLAIESVTAFVDASGTQVTAPIYGNRRYAHDWSVFIDEFEQEQQTPGTLPLIGATGAGLVNLGSSVATLVLDNPGAHYTYQPRITIGPSTSTDAEASLTMTLELTEAFAVVAGDGYVPGDDVTINAAGSNAIGVVDGVGINSANLTSAGTGFTSVPMNDILVGGSHTAAGYITITSGALKSITVLLGGQDYHINDTALLAGGVFSVQAQVTITHVGVFSGVPVAIGTGYAVNDLFTAAGGTSSSKAVFRVNSLGLATVLVNAAGRAYLPGQTITLLGGSPSSTPIATVATVTVVYTGNITNGALTQGGKGYDVGNTITATGGIAATNAVFTVVTVAAATMDIDSGGSGHAVGDVVTLAGGTQTSRASIFVESVDGSGVILTFSVAAAGNYTVKTTTFTQFSTTGSGTGATFKNALFSARTVSITTAGNYSSAPSLLTQASTSGSGFGAAIPVQYGVLTVTVTSKGDFPSGTPSAFTQYSTSGFGDGATFNTPAWGIGNVTRTTAGDYTVEPAGAFTQFSTTGGGTGATIQPNSYQAVAVSVTINGVYTASPPAVPSFTRFSTSGLGTGMSFSSPLFGVVTFLIFDPGKYTGTLPTTLTSSLGAAFDTLTWGVGSVVISDGGSGFDNFPLQITGVTIDSPGVGYVPGEVATFTPFDGQTFSVKVLTIKGTGSSGPVATIAMVTDQVASVAIHPNSMVSQTSTTGTGAGLTVKNPVTRTYLPLVGGSGTGAIITQPMTVDEIELETGGSGYVEAPAVTIEGNAVAHTTITPFTFQGSTSYIVDVSSERIHGSDRVLIKWTSMPLPPDRKDYINWPFTKPETIVFTSSVVHRPARIGFDFLILNASRTGEFRGDRTLRWKLGQWSKDDLDLVWHMSAPGYRSRAFPITRLTRHIGFTYIDNDNDDNNESFPASEESGYDPIKGFRVASDQSNPIGNMWVWREIFLPPP